MSVRPVRALPVLLAASLGWSSGCQLLYEKNDLTVSTGGGGATTDSTTSGTGGTSTSSGGTGGVTTSMGGGGTGGVTTSTGEGGSGGTTTTSMGGGGTGGVTTSTGEGGSGGTTTTTSPPCDEPLFVFATSDAAVTCARYSPVSGWTSTSSVNGSSGTRPAAAMLDPMTGVGVFYQGTGTQPLRAVEMKNKVCGMPGNVLGITTNIGPSATYLGGGARVLFRGAEGMGLDFPYEVVWNGMAWTVTGQISASQAGAIPGIAASGAELLAVYGKKANSELTRVVFSGNAWGGESCFPGSCAAGKELTKSGVTPGVAGLGGGGWLVVFHDFANDTLRWLTFVGGSASASNAVADSGGTQYPAASGDAVSLAQIEGGAAIAYRSKAGFLVAGTYDEAAGTWSPVASPGAASITSSPAVTAGVCTHRAEVVYIESAGGTVAHASLEGGVWSAPVTVGGAAMKGVSIARAP